jgi:hypothetical protein
MTINNQSFLGVPQHPMAGQQLLNTQLHQVAAKPARLHQQIAQLPA